MKWKIVLYHITDAPSIADSSEIIGILFIVCLFWFVCKEGCNIIIIISYYLLIVALWFKL